MNLEQAVAAHYASGNLAEKIFTAVGRRTGLTVADLAPFDEFHLGGRRATATLAAALNVQPVMKILDIGCGLGGAARFIAETSGSAVSGIDLTSDYIESARLLNIAVSQVNVEFQAASALALPFPDRSFDAAYTIHASMNIQNKAALYGEAWRVLKPGAVFGLYDVMGEGAIAYPVPWADSPDTSFLVTADAAQVMLNEAGFTVLQADNRRQEALQSLVALEKAGAWAGPRLVMGEDYQRKLTNLRLNLEQSLCAPWQIICRRS